MSIKPSVLIGEAVLRETAKEVSNQDSDKIQSYITDLVDTMRKEELIGLSAPQLNVSKQIIVTEIRETKFRKGITDELRVYINPEITDFSRETTLDWEGCGSIPGLFGKVERSIAITLKYLDQKGVSREMSATGLLARVIQHEVNHLNGILFTDLADPQSLVSREYYLKHVRGK